MKQSLLKKMCYIAAAAMLTGAVGVTAAYAANEGADNEPAEEKAPEVGETAENAGEPEKDETVYVLAKANGAVNKVIVSDHLKNTDAKSLLTETSELKNVENVKGDETFSESGDTRTWNAGGKDIYYQGTSDAELPLDISISYKLGGKDISPEELVGKSGKVTVRFDYTNKLSEEVTVKGEKTAVYVPFAALTALMLDDDSFRNIEVTNGRKMDDGDRTFIVGTAFPGLSESLDIKDGKLEIPEYFEFTADVTDFSMANTVTVVTNEVFNKLGVDLDSDGEELTEDIDRLHDAVSQLTDGTERLHDGLAELLDKSSALTDGVGALRDGADSLKDGAEKANDGAAQLYTGSEKLSEGLDTLNSNSAQLTAGSEQVFNSLLDMANSQLEAAGITGYKLTIANYAETLDKLVASLDGDNALKTAQDTAKKQVTEAVEANRAAVEAEVTKAVTEQVTAKVNEAVKTSVTEKVTEAVKAKVLAGVLAAQNMTVEQYQQGVAAGVIDAAAQQKIEGAVAQQLGTDEIKAQISAAVEQQMQTPEVKAQADAALAQQLGSDEVKAAIKQNTDEQVEKLITENLSSKDVQDKIKAGADEAKAGAAKLKALKEQLDSYNTFYTGLAQYTDGVAQAADGAKQVKDGLGALSDGTKQLADGSGQLADGVKQLDDKVPALLDGINQLTDGSEQLADGAQRFSDEGISKLVELVGGDLGKAIDRFNAMSELSQRYETYSGGKGSVKFIYRTDAVEK
ncbi:MAG: hypothetical protein J6N15_09890 [Ruminiclostridium sp.]|nr:hypothetical protein [Ruminiclostridium sp.]